MAPPNSLDTLVLPPHRSSSPSPSSATSFPVRRWGVRIRVVFLIISIWWSTQLLFYFMLSTAEENQTSPKNLPRVEADSISSSSPSSSLRPQHDQEPHDLLQNHRDIVEQAQETKRPKSKRQAFEETHSPNGMERIRRAVENLRVPMPLTPKLSTYDIFDCPPDSPPLGYPHHWPMRQILKDWNPDDTNIPSQIYQSLCVFDWNDDYETIAKYREAEVPFIVQNQPDLMRTSERWMSSQTHLHENNRDDPPAEGSSSSYLEQLVGSDAQVNEYSHSNHFMYWKDDGPVPHDWQRPTERVQLSYREWYQRGMALEQDTTSTSHVSRDHWYFRLNANGPVNPHMYDELPFFRPKQDPSSKNSIFIVEPDQARGINCRFGMRGVLSEAHYDGTRNWIVLLGGQRRYILSHPRECNHLHLYPWHHPSGRHSSVDWSNITHDDTILRRAKGTEVVLQAADALYLPTYWMHFIVSLNINYQCNARSGTTRENEHYIDSCGLNGF